jgi:hypothetical protein
MFHAFSALYFSKFQISHGLTRIFTIGFHHEGHEGHEEVSPRITRNGKPKRIQKTTTDISSAHHPDPARASQKPFF